MTPVKQHGDGHSHGHSDITREAVARLYLGLQDENGLIRGLTQQQYFDALDEGQRYQDSPIGWGWIEDVQGLDGVDLPFAGPGPTMHSAYFNPTDQVYHAMADPEASGELNLSNLRRMMATETAEAHGLARTAPDEDRLQDEMKHLGVVAHALQDSYSGAHTWRDMEQVYENGDPEAAVEKFNVFTPLHVIGLDDRRNTHDDRFDKPDIWSGSARAATEATYRLLTAHEAGVGRPPEQAARLMATTLDPMTTGAAEIGVNLDSEDPAWRAERDTRLEREHSGAEKYGEMLHLGRMMGAPGAGYGADAGAATAGAGERSQPQHRSGRQTRGGGIVR